MPELTTVPVQVEPAPLMSIWDLARTYWPILAASAGVSLLLTPACRAFALKRRIVDRPDDFLKPHGRPIPYLGGVAIFAGWACGLLVSLLLFPGTTASDVTPHDGPAVRISTVVAVLVSGTLITALGLTDDLRMLSPRIKLVGNVVAAGVLIYAGIGDDVVNVIASSLRGSIQDYPRWLITVYSVPIAIFVIVGACNATNLIDGMDGLCSGVLGIIALGFLVLAANMHVFGGWQPAHVHRVVFALAMMGGAIGFLPYNRNPATIFMGDAGSMLLGLNAAVLLLLFAETTTIRWVLASLMVFGLPVADMLLTLARRWRSERPLMEGDRSHFYDQLSDRGFTVRQVVAISYALATAFAFLGCISIAVRTRYTILLYGLAVVTVLWAVKRFGMCRAQRT